MRVVFMGTPDFAATILQEISIQHTVVAAYTRPDAVRGRGNELVASPVKKCAEELGIPVYCPTSFKSEEELARLRSLQPDVLIVAAYGALLPAKVTSIARYGAINAHASLLPRWRGAAPVERAILAGDKQVGVCAMRVDEKLDAGPYCVSRSISVEHRSASDLLDELANVGAEALLNALAQLEAGRVFWVEQNQQEVTYAKKIEKGELDISLEDSAFVADRKIRASSDAHACRVEIAGKQVTLLSGQAYLLETAGNSDSKPALNDVYPSLSSLPEPLQEALVGLETGSVAFVQKRLFLGTKEGVLEVFTLKPAGKKEMDAKSFAAGIQNIKKEPTYWRSCGN